MQAGLDRLDPAWDRALLIGVEESALLGVCLDLGGFDVGVVLGAVVGLHRIPKAGSGDLGVHETAIGQVDRSEVAPIAVAVLPVELDPYGLAGRQQATELTGRLRGKALSLGLGVARLGRIDVEEPDLAVLRLVADDHRVAVDDPDDLDFASLALARQDEDRQTQNRQDADQRKRPRRVAATRAARRTTYCEGVHGV